jgi:hypothetical protein
VESGRRRVGVYQRTKGEPDSQGARVPSRAELEGLLDKIIVRLIRRRHPEAGAGVGAKMMKLR